MMKSLVDIFSCKYGNNSQNLHLGHFEKEKEKMAPPSQNSYCFGVLQATTLTTYWPYDASSVLATIHIQYYFASRACL